MQSSDCGVGDCIKGLLLHWLSVRTSPLVELNSNYLLILSHISDKSLPPPVVPGLAGGTKERQQTNAPKAAESTNTLQAEHSLGLRGQQQERAEGPSWTEISRLPGKGNLKELQSLLCICSLSFSVGTQVTFSNLESSSQKTETSDTTNYTYE